jgi:hypothetical protein
MGICEGAKGQFLKRPFGRLVEEEAFEFFISAIPLLGGQVIEGARALDGVCVGPGDLGEDGRDVLGWFGGSLGEANVGPGGRFHGGGADGRDRT